MHPRGNIPPKNPHHILESSNEDELDDNPLAGGPSTSTKPKGRHSQGRSWSVNDEEDIEDTHPQHKKHPNKLKGRLGKKPREKSTDIDSSISDDQASERKKHAGGNSLQTVELTASRDSDIEEIANPKESSEDELGELLGTVSQIQEYLPRYL